jgi:hypothetical protein
MATFAASSTLSQLLSGEFNPSPILKSIDQTVIQVTWWALHTLERQRVSLPNVDFSSNPHLLSNLEPFMVTCGHILHLQPVFGQRLHSAWITHRTGIETFQHLNCLPPLVNLDPVNNHTLHDIITALQEAAQLDAIQRRHLPPAPRFKDEVFCSEYMRGVGCISDEHIAYHHAELKNASKDYIVRCECCLKLVRRSLCCKKPLPAHGVVRNVSVCNRCLNDATMSSA